jgi:hypothetical protein
MHRAESHRLGSGQLHLMSNVKRCEEVLVVRGRRVEPTSIEMGTALESPTMKDIRNRQ